MWSQSSRDAKGAECSRGPHLVRDSRTAVRRDLRVPAYAPGMNAQGHGAADLRRVLADAFYGATISGVDFSHAELASVSARDVLLLHRCNFAGADLRQATLEGWRFTLCDLRGANLRGASLRGASFAGCDLTGADLRDTDLTHAHFDSVGVGESAIETRLTDVLWDRGVPPTTR
jgi:uncharacterized protein YjbI with pentapeptide repeats